MARSRAVNGETKVRICERRTGSMAPYPTAADRPMALARTAALLAGLNYIPRGYRLSLGDGMTVPV
jgi:hypothetical protein